MLETKNLELRTLTESLPRGTSINEKLADLAKVSNDTGKGKPYQQHLL